jgi:hypothetical protein
LCRTLDAELEGMRSESKKMYRDLGVLVGELCNINTQINTTSESEASANYSHHNKLDQIKANLDGYLK